MARRHMRNLVSHHARQLRLGLRAQNHPGVHEQKAAGQGEGIHLVAVDHLGSDWDLRVRTAPQVRCQAVDEFSRMGSLHDSRFLLHLLRQLSAQRNFLFQGIQVDA
jgi:hypothetical protein